MVHFLATDGGYRSSTNIGAWAFVVEGDISIVDFGTEEGTTNQKMELKAIIEALKYAKNNFPNEEIGILSDSAYCVNGMNQRWFDKWILNRWLNSKNEPVKNGWDFMARYWWIVFPIGGFLSWLIPELTGK